MWSFPYNFSSLYQNPYYQQTPQINRSGPSTPPQVLMPQNQQTSNIPWMRSSGDMNMLAGLLAQNKSASPQSFFGGQLMNSPYAQYLR